MYVGECILTRRLNVKLNFTLLCGVAIASVPRNC